MSRFCHLPYCALRVPHCDSETLHLAILANFVDIVLMVNILVNCTLKPWGSIGAFYSVERIGGFAPFSWQGPPLPTRQYSISALMFKKRDCLMRFKWAEKGKTVSPAQIVLVFWICLFFYFHVILLWTVPWVCSKNYTTKYFLHCVFFLISNFWNLFLCDVR